MLAWRPPILETERLFLRPIEEGDADAIFAYASVEDVAMNTSWYAHESMEATQDFIYNYVFEKYNQKIPEPWGITFRENPEMVIGTVGITPSTAQDHVMRFHYGLSDTFWGQGIIPEAGRAVIAHAFEVYKPKRIHAYCTSANPSSARALEKIGFIKEGVMRAAIHSKGEFRNTVNFSILDSDWHNIIKQKKSA